MSVWAGLSLGNGRNRIGGVCIGRLALWVLGPVLLMSFPPHSHPSKPTKQQQSMSLDTTPPCVREGSMQGNLEVITRLYTLLYVYLYHPDFPGS